MEKKKDPCIILGEAPESDEEETGEIDSCKIESAVVAGEASESDCDSDDVYNITSEAFASRSKSSPMKGNSSKGEPKYNSLLHKKLRESNWKLKQKLKEFAKQQLEFAGSAVGEVNQELLGTQMSLHGAAASLRRCAIDTSRLDSALSNLLAQSNPSLARINIPKSAIALQPFPSPTPY